MRKNAENLCLILWKTLRTKDELYLHFFYVSQKNTSASFRDHHAVSWSWIALMEFLDLDWELKNNLDNVVT